MKKKCVLLVTTVSGFVPQFEMNNVRILQDMGYEVHYATNYNYVSYGSDNHRLDQSGIIRHQVDFVRSPFQVRANIRAYRQLRHIMKKGEFSLVHCHTPMGAVLARLSALPLRRKGLRVIYTAHGFHFFKGAPLINWLCFYPVERLLASYTDVLITINREDYDCAYKFCQRKKTKVKYVPGVGVDIAYWSGIGLTTEEKQRIRVQTRDKLEVTSSEFVFLSVGELIPRKNHASVIRALADIRKEGVGDFHYFICGQGELKEELQQIIHENDMDEHVTLLGYRKDIRDLLYASDAFVFPSLQEGLPVALMEAIAANVPVIASDIRGNRELVKDSGDLSQCFHNNNSLQEALSRVLHQRLEQEHLLDVEAFCVYDLEQISKQMKKIYEDIER